MRLFPTAHLTGADLPEPHRDHLERHGIAVVGLDEGPDVVVVAPGAPLPDLPGESGVVLLLDGEPHASVAALLADVGVTASGAPAPAPLARPERPGGPVDDLLAWTAPHAPVRATATLTVEDPAVPALVAGTTPDGHPAPRGAVVAAMATDAASRRVLALGVDVLTDATEVLLDAVAWAAPRAAAATSMSPSGAGRAVTASPAWTALKEAVGELRTFQDHDGAVPDVAHHDRARELVTVASRAVADLAGSLPHDADYLAAVVKDLERWSDGGFEVPDFLESLLAFHPERQRVDGLAHLVVFPMYTQNGSPDRLLEAVVLEVLWPAHVEHLEAETYTNALFVPVTFVDFTAGYDTNSAVLFPETVAVREVPAFTWGAIFADREAARFRRVVRAAAETTRLALPPDAARLLDDQRLAEETFVLWDLIHDRTHMRGDLPFDPFMIKQRMPYFLYSLEELRCDLTAFREAVRLEADGVPHARLVQYAVLFDRIFRFAVTGSRVRNYDGLGGQLLFAWLHQHGVLHWTDSRLTIDWRAVPASVMALGEQIEQLYWRSIDRPKTAHWLAAYELVAGTLTPHPASAWARGLPEDVLAGPPKGLTDAVLPDEFPLSMFYEALARKIGDVVDSTRGITA